MIRTLNAPERRVLGVLIEKSLTQPDGYPMTLNSIQTGCNQKSNRDPVTDLNDDAIWHTLKDLQQQGLVTRVLAGPGGRTDRFKHEVLAHYGWGKRQQAIMAELLLRGPQTAPELKTRCARMTAFEDVAAVMLCLGALEASDPPMVAALVRQPGQRETRFAHLLYPPNEQPPASGVKVADVAAPASSASGETESIEGRAEGCASTSGSRWSAAGGAPHPKESAGSAAWRTELENVQAEIADLHAEIAELRRRLDALEGSLGRG